jgi:hypothetical protein
MKTLFTILIMALLLFCSGCNVLGLIASPTPHEKKVPAELDLKRYEDKKILVFVDSHAKMRSAVNIKALLSTSLQLYIEQKVRLKADDFVPVEMLDYLKGQRTDFKRLSPSKIGSLLSADLVLYVLVDDYKLNAMSNTGYYTGNLSVRSMMFDAGSGQLLWPSTKAGRASKSSIDLSAMGQSEVNQKLVKSVVHGIVRCFYDCPKNEYRPSNEVSDYGRRDW